MGLPSVLRSQGQLLRDRLLQNLGAPVLGKERTGGQVQSDMHTRRWDAVRLPSQRPAVSACADSPPRDVVLLCGLHRQHGIQQKEHRVGTLEVAEAAWRQLV